MDNFFKCHRWQIAVVQVEQQSSGHAVKQRIYFSVEFECHTTQTWNPFIKDQGHPHVLFLS